MNNGFDCSQERERMIKITPLLSKSALNLQKPFLGLTNSLLSCEGKDQLKIITIYSFPCPNFKREHLNRRNVCIYAKARTACGLSESVTLVLQPGGHFSAQRSALEPRGPPNAALTATDPHRRRTALRRCPSLGLERAGMAHAQRRPPPSRSPPSPPQLPEAMRDEGPRTQARLRRPPPAGIAPHGAGCRPSLGGSSRC